MNNKTKNALKIIGIIAATKPFDILSFTYGYGFYKKPDIQGLEHLKTDKAIIFLLPQNAYASTNPPLSKQELLTKITAQIRHVKEHNAENKKGLDELVILEKNITNNIETTTLTDQESYDELKLKIQKPIESFVKKHDRKYGDLLIALSCLIPAYSPFLYCSWKGYCSLKKTRTN